MEFSDNLITVAMCTYRREHLKQTLNSLSEIIIPNNYSIKIIVVDNDSNKYGESIVKSFSNNFSEIKIDYINEPRKNISAARNACLNNASGQWIAFIDDDEVADRYWLINLLKTAEKYSANVVVGYVESILPEETPSWILEGKIFDRVRHKTGTVLDTCGAGCTLVDLESIGNQKFDLEYGLSGGEDSEFFYRLNTLNKKIVYCSEAVVYERVMSDRVSFNFLWNRKMRIGNTYYKYRYKNVSFINKCCFISKVIIELFLLLLLSLFLPLCKDATKYKILLKLADRYGKFKSAFSKKINSLY